MSDENAQRPVTPPACMHRFSGKVRSVMATTSSPEAPAFWSWFDHFVWTVKSAALRTGLELAIWGKIAAGDRTAETIAAREGWDVQGVHRLLNMLVSIGLLAIETDGYSLVPEAVWYLVPGQPTYMGDFLLYLLNWEGDRLLPAAIRTGKRPIGRDILRADLDEVFAEFFAYHRAAPEQSADQAASVWDALGVRAGAGLRVLDFACGSAIATLALCRRHPGVRATLQDRPRVLEIAQEIACALGVADQIELLPGDMRVVDFGVGRFDIARVRNALFYLGPDAIIEVLGRIRTALKPDGQLFAEDTLANEQVTKDAYPPTDALWLYAITEQGGTYTFTEWQGFLTQAGFCNVTRIGSILRAEAPM